LLCHLWRAEQGNLGATIPFPAPSSCFLFDPTGFPVQLPQLNFVSEEVLVVFEVIYQWQPNDMRADGDVIR